MLVVMCFMAIGSAQAQPSSQANDFGGSDYSYDFSGNGSTSSSSGTGIKGLFGKLTGLIDSLIGILVSLGLLFFVYHVFRYVTSGADPTKKAEASRYMLYGIFSLLVMVSVWGFVNLLTETTGLEPSNLLPDFK